MLAGGFAVASGERGSGVSFFLSISEKEERPTEPRLWSPCLLAPPRFVLYQGASWLWVGSRCIS